MFVEQIDYSGDFSRMLTEMESLRLDVNKQKMTTDKLSNLKVENKTVYLSPPDSTGKQYPIKESTTTASKDEQTKKRVDETFTLTMQQLYSRLDSMGSKIDALIKERDKIVELSWWDLHKNKIYPIIISLLIVGRIVYHIRKK